MSFFSDFVMAERAETDDVAANANRAHAWPTLKAKNLTSLEVAILWAVLDRAHQPIELFERFDLLVASEAAQISRVPGEFLKVVADLDDARLESASREWAASEELLWDPADARSFLDEFRTFANEAVSNDRSILLVVSGI